MILPDSLPVVYCVRTVTRQDDYIILLITPDAHDCSFDNDTASLRGFGLKTWHNPWVLRE